MPATRLRNHDWQRSLRQVQERGGSLDIAIATQEGRETEIGTNVLWRVRVLDVTDDFIFVEQPGTLGKALDLQENIELVVILTIGQNRWMFRTRHAGLAGMKDGGVRAGHRPITAMRLAMPAQVERCQRRSNYRVSTASLSLPQVDAWPLLDPRSVILAERANEVAFESNAPERTGGDETLRLPDVGPRFTAQLVNLGGGGVGLVVANNESQSLLRHKMFWLRVALPPELLVPICATAKLVHTHMTATQEYYAGLGFDFTFNPAHQKCVVEQIGRYVAAVQRAQLLRKSA